MRITVRQVLVVTLAGATLVTLGSACMSRSSGGYRTFGTPEDAVRALTDAAKKDTTDDLLAIFGPEAADLIASSDPATTRQNRQVFTVAAAERWQLEDGGAGRKTLVIGRERWPFPIPLVTAAGGWHFDTAAGRDEVLARRIGRNELAAIRICRTYVAAQYIYAARGHDGQRAGLYANAFHSDPGQENGLYWAATAGQKRSPLGELMAGAAADGRRPGQAGASPSPFHGYYFRILTAQGPSATGGEKSYVVDRVMSGGFALVAWPAAYDVTGVMSFTVNQDGVVRERDLGSETDAVARNMSRYDPDPSWSVTK